MSEVPVERRPRRDVERNVVALLEAAKEVFAVAGVAAPAKEITDRAGVGVGTLYRHFPKRSDLIAAVLQQEVDECVAAAHDLARTRAPFDALTAWVDRYVGLLATKRGLAEALHSADPAYEGLPHSLLARLEPAVDRIMADGRENGTVLNPISAHDLLIGIALLSQEVTGESPEVGRRLVTLLIDGLPAAPSD